jgi:hypothetical protein
VRSFTFIKTCCAILIFLAGSLCAQEMEPRAYSNAPVGMNFLAASYGWSQGNIVTDATLPIEDFHVTAHTIALGYVRTLGLFGKEAKIQALAPFAWLAGNVKLAGRDTSGTRTGLTDARLKFTVNLFGGPALAPGEFRGYQQKTIIGASLVISIPIGQYDASKRVNLGANRWGVKPELGISHRFGKWYAELYSGIWLISDNNQFLETSTLSQEPIIGTQGHVSYVFRPGLWLAVNGVYVDGGETSVNGVARHDFQRNWRFGATCSLPLSRQHSLKFVFNTGVATRVGGDFDSFTVVYQHSWL